METGLEKGERSETFAEIPDKDWKPELKGRERGTSRQDKTLEVWCTESQGRKKEGHSECC